MLSSVLLYYVFIVSVLGRTADYVLWCQGGRIYNHINRIIFDVISLAVFRNEQLL